MRHPGFKHAWTEDGAACWRCIAEAALETGRAEGATQEREACAQVVEAWNGFDGRAVPAAAIRARGEASRKEKDNERVDGSDSVGRPGGVRGDVLPVGGVEPRVGAPKPDARELALKALRRMEGYVSGCGNEDGPLVRAAIAALEAK